MVQIISSPFYMGCNTNAHFKIGDQEFDLPGQHKVDAPGDTSLIELFRLALDANANIVGDSVVKTAVPYDFPFTFNLDGVRAQLLLQWNQITPQSPPDPDSAR